MTHARFRFRLLPVLMALFLVVAGCDSNDDGGDNGNNNGNPFGSGSMEATVNGNSFDAAVVVGIFQSGIVSVTGNLGATQAGVQEQISITVVNAAEGTFQVSAIGGGATAIYASGSLTGADAWAGISGSVTIDNLSTEGVSGTFSFTGQNNAQQQVQVTNGEFSASF